MVSQEWSPLVTLKLYSQLKDTMSKNAENLSMISGVY